MGALGLAVMVCEAELVAPAPGFPRLAVPRGVVDAEAAGEGDVENVPILPPAEALPDDDEEKGGEKVGEAVPAKLRVTVSDGRGEAEEVCAEEGVGRRDIEPPGPSGVGLFLAVALPPSPVALPEALSEGLAVELRVLPCSSAVPVAARRVKEGRAGVSVPAADAVAGGVGRLLALALPEDAALRDSEGQRVAVGARGVAVAFALRVPALPPVPVARRGEGLPEGEGEALPAEEPHALPVGRPEGEGQGDAVPGAVGVCVALTVALGGAVHEAVAQALGSAGVGVGERVSLPVEDRGGDGDALAVRVPAPAPKGDSVPPTNAVGVTGAVSVGRVGEAEP